ncbi:I78 family peptidase inhibitor [Sphingomonas sp. KC8]|uniref:I78 family peptidase inhibitor n=1 Tax=Sphingomonas sp. KC8 TaxID=1030157 RepID=UPI0002EA24D0|nr:I78 family peptidase inhibitor [Sphingomonas sp. KC8]ARS25757.1 hypothetical protein KC8_00415 [Sphingomonas sp. KC8]
MQMKALIAASAGALLLAGCMESMPGPDRPRPPRPPHGQCQADRAQSFVGQVAEDRVVERARRAARARTVRVLRPGQPVTMDYRVDRLNIEIDTRSFILSVRCG